MTEPRLTLHGVSFELPNGRRLFSDLSVSFGSQHTGLVGRNGVGKSVLARILAGQCQPSSGSCTRTGTIHYLAQNSAQALTQHPLAEEHQPTVATLVGIQPALHALARIEQGNFTTEDDALLVDRWDIRQQLQAELLRCGLPHTTPETPVSTLSCGQAMRAALIEARLSGADFLILDEPSNHLDAPSRQALAQQLCQWRGGLLLISHDRQLLDTMDRIVELTPKAFITYGGHYGFYRQVQQQQTQNALDALAQRKLERSRQERTLRTQQERQRRKQAAGTKAARHSNQAKVLLNFQKERSQASDQRLAQQKTSMRETLNASVREAAQAIDWQASAIHLQVPLLQAQAAQDKRIVAELADVQLPFLHALCCMPNMHTEKRAPKGINLQLRAGQRLAICGPNGCGKSPLLRVLAGDLPPLQGTRRVQVSFAWLDQRLSKLNDAQSVLVQLHHASPNTPQALQRMRLAQLGLNAQHTEVPCGQLSGGERLKAALACTLYADETPQMLLLDEADNHLDLASLLALQAMLRQYPGTLVIVSHDEALLQAVGLTHRLTAFNAHWQLEECAPHTC